METGSPEWVRWAGADYRWCTGDDWPLGLRLNRSGRSPQPWAEDCPEAAAGSGPRAMQERGRSGSWERAGQGSLM